jgi:MFS family permease
MVEETHGFVSSVDFVACWCFRLSQCGANADQSIRFVSFGWINCIGVFQEYYQTHQLKAYPSSTISWISSLEAFMMFSGGPIVGRLYDEHGPSQILLVGSFLHVFGLMMTSLCTEYYQFVLAQGICSPVGSSMVFYAGMFKLPLLRITLC